MVVESAELIGLLCKAASFDAVRRFGTFRMGASQTDIEGRGNTVFYVRVQSEYAAAVCPAGAIKERHREAIR